MPKEYSRTQRIADLMQRELAQILQRDMNDPRFKFVTVTRIKVSSDLSYADVFITQLLDDIPIQETLKALKRAASHLRYLLAQRIELRIMPLLRFIHDTSLSESAHLTDLINKAVTEDEKKHKK